VNERGSKVISHQDTGRPLAERVQWECRAVAQPLVGRHVTPGERERETGNWVERSRGLQIRRARRLADLKAGERALSGVIIGLHYVPAQKCIAPFKKAAFPP